MQYRKIPHTDIEVSVISLGTWAIGGRDWGEVDDRESISTIRAAVDCGINLIDTAPIYGRGHSEQIVGKAIRGIRDKFYIATKCGIQPHGKGFTFNLRPEVITRELEGSLKRLGVETIDIYQCHYPDPDTPVEETLVQMLKFKEQGKIRYIGLSNFSLSLLKDALSCGPVATLQVQYSLLYRNIERDIVDFCLENGIGIMAYGPLGGGILTGKYTTTPSFPKGDARSFFYPYYREPYWSRVQNLIEAIRDIASKRGRSLSEVALNWVIQQRGVVTALVGCRTRHQLTSNASSANWMLNPDELERLTRISDELISDRGNQD